MTSSSERARPVDVEVEVPRAPATPPPGARDVSSSPDLGEGSTGYGATLSSAPAEADIPSLLHDAVGKLLAAFDEKVAYDKGKENHLTRLHSELQEYKSDLLSRAVRPYVAGLVRLHDEMGKQARRVREYGTDPVRAGDVYAILDGLRDDIALLLEENGIHMFEEPGQAFNPKRQTCSRTVPTEDVGRIGHVAQRLRPGFEDGNRPVQKERVAVYTQCAQGPVEATDPDAVPEPEGARRRWPPFSP